MDATRPAGTESPERDHPHVITLPPLIYLGFLLLGILMDFIWPTSFGSWAASLGSLLARLLLGGALVALGVVLGGWAVVTFIRAGTHLEVYRPAVVLVTKGPYRFTRNPIYVGMTLAHTGFAIAANSLWALLMLLPALVVIHYGVIRREEEYLYAKFGEPYGQYLQSVRRWI